VKVLLLKNKVTDTNFDEEKEIKEVIKVFGLDGDKKITKEEFVSGFTFYYIYMFYFSSNF